VVAGFSSGLLALYHFQNFSLYGVIANMIAVPLTAFVIMPFGMIAFFLIPFGLSDAPLAIMGWGVEGMMETARRIAALEGAVWRITAWPAAGFYMLAVGAVFALLWRGFSVKIVFLALCLAGAIVIAFHDPPDIQVASEGGLVSVRGGDGGLHISSRRVEKFTAENWMRRNGQEGEVPAPWPREGGAESFPLVCDPDACRGKVEGIPIRASRGLRLGGSRDRPAASGSEPHMRFANDYRPVQPLPSRRSCALAQRAAGYED